MSFVVVRVYGLCDGNGVPESETCTLRSFHPTEAEANASVEQEEDAVNLMCLETEEFYIHLVYSVP